MGTGGSHLGRQEVVTASGGLELCSRSKWNSQSRVSESSVWSWEWLVGAGWSQDHWRRAGQGVGGITHPEVETTQDYKAGVLESVTLSLKDKGAPISGQGQGRAQTKAFGYRGCCAWLVNRAMGGCGELGTGGGAQIRGCMSCMGRGLA